MNTIKQTKVLKYLGIFYPEKYNLISNDSITLDYLGIKGRPDWIIENKENKSINILDYKNRSYSKWGIFKKDRFQAITYLSVVVITLSSLLIFAN